MKYDDITPTMRMFMGNREGLRRLGFLPEQLFAKPAKSARFRVLSLFLNLKTQDKEFDIECGPIESERACRKEYKRVTKAINSGRLPEADFQRIWEESEAYMDTVSLVFAIEAKGIRIPGKMSN